MDIGKKLPTNISNEVIRYINSLQQILITEKSGVSIATVQSFIKDALFVLYNEDEIIRNSTYLCIANKIEMMNVLETCIDNFEKSTPIDFPINQYYKQFSSIPNMENKELVKFLMDKYSNQLTEDIIIYAEKKIKMDLVNKKPLSKEQKSFLDKLTKSTI